MTGWNQIESENTMDNSTYLPKPNNIAQPWGDSSRSQRELRGLGHAPASRRLMTCLTGLVCLLLATSAARADRSPTNCTGSGLGISLYTSIPDVHIGDTLFYSINVFNGSLGSGAIACDASSITAFIVTPDGVTNNVTLIRTTLTQGQSDFYSNVVSYVVRAQDIQPSGTLLATARDIGVIHQNIVNSIGGGFQGVNTEVNLPCVLLTAQCVGGVGENGAITFTGTVTNCGNNTLVGVTVTNFVNNGAFTVLFPTNLARGEIAPFSGSWVPLNPCGPNTAILTVRATDQFSSTPRTVTNFTTLACENTLTAGINVTKACPAQPVSPGQLLTFSGSVSNTGNVTLTNIVVVNNQPAANTQVFTLASLAPGTMANFTASYIAPANCSVADTLTATAASDCGAPVISSVSATCPILTTPQITVTTVRPPNPVSPGGLLTYSGTVSNAGNITLTNVAVLNNLSGTTPVFKAATLPPGAGASFTGSYLAPADCSSTSTSTATGQSICGVAVTNAVSTTCPILTTPLLAVTQKCPVTPTIAGDLLTYSGTVSNTGNITLTNVVVLNDQTGATPVFTAATLAPGAGASFTGSYLAPFTCSSTSTSTATGQSICGAPVTSAASTTCPILTIPSIAITLGCPLKPVSPSALLTYTGTVSNPGNIILTNIVVLNSRSGTTPVFTAETLAPGASANFTGSYTAPASGYATSTATVRAGSLCNITVTNSASLSCPIVTSPGIAATKACPPEPVIPGGKLVFTGTVTNTGNIVLTNVMVFDNQPAPNTRLLGPIKLARGAGTNFTGSYTAPLDACATSDTLTVTGNDATTGKKVTNTVSVTCPLITIPGIAVTQNCPPNPVSPGGLLTYSGTVSNAGNVTLTSVVVMNNLSGATPIFTAATLAPGAIANFTGSYVAPTNCSTTSTSTATGLSICGVSVTNAASATCPITTTPLLAVTQNCPVNPVSPGGLLTYSGTVSNAGNITITNVVVLNNLSGSTPVFTAATLAPGAVANFTGSYLAPTNCSSASTSTATGRSVCGVAVTSAASTTCPIATLPSLTVTQNCPVNPVSPGGLLTYSGTVSNAGNIMLTNVVVLNNLSGSTPVFTAATLAPGAVANFTGSYLAPTNCSTPSTSTATAQSICGVAVTGAASTTCPITTTPLLAVTENCPVTPTAPGALLTYSGTVSNAGNITITNVVVLNNLSGSTPVFTAATLAPGAVGNFTGSYLEPTNCSTPSTSTATGESICGVAVTGAASAICPTTTTPLLAVTQNCPANPVSPGSLLTYSGTVSNAGNITLTNVVVLNNLSGSTPVFTAATMAPGAVGNFTGSYLAPAECSSTSTSTATGRSTCGIAVTATASATCPILTTPAIAVTQTCPITNVLPGGILTYSGTVSNAGNITLTNIIVVDNRPASNTLILTLAALAPGATTNFTGSYKVPLDCCVVWNTLGASGQGCAGVTVTDTDTSVCTVLTLPGIVVTKICPSGVLLPGDLLSYSGIVSNSGDITLINVTVVNNESSSGSPVLGPIDLAPGQSVNYNASYIIPPDFCGIDTVTASGLDVCTLLPVVNSVTTTCPVSTAPGITVTKNCPLLPTPRGGLYTFTGSVSNSGNVTLVSVFVVDDQPTNNTPVIGPIALAPGASVNFTNSYMAPTCCCLIIDTLTALGQDHCSGSNVTAMSTAVCPVLTAPSIALVQDCPTAPIPMGSVYMFTGYVTNTGNAVLTNVFVFGPQGTNTPVLGPIDLAPAEYEFYFGIYTVPSNTCSVSVTASGQDTCLGNLFSDTASCPVATIPAITITESCPTGTTPPGSPFVFGGSVTNTGNITLTNILVLSIQTSSNVTVLGPITLVPGASAPFSGSYIVVAGSNPATNTVMAIGVDDCQARTVTAAVNCLGPVAHALPASIIGMPIMANGVISVSFPTVNGKSYTLQYKNALSDPTWIDSGTVVGTGGFLSITDGAAFTGSARFYRIIVAP
jgi:uncharacterized repeat protein (TIGR01451 family)